MKTVLIFIGLKVLEIGGAIALYCFSSWYWSKIYDFESFWLNGWYGLVAPFILCGLLCVIFFAIRGFFVKNIEWAKKLSRKQ